MEQQFEIPEWNQLPNEARPKIRYWMPAAAVDPEDLKKELHQLKERGFGGVEVVSLGMLPQEILVGEEGWGSTLWNDTIELISKTCQELGMSMDLTNGPGWPISMPTLHSPDDEGVICELTYGIIECPEQSHYSGPIPSRRKLREGGTPRLVHVLAYQQREDGRLCQSTYQNLMPYVSGTGLKASLNCTLPPAEKGCKWLIFAFFQQPSMNRTLNDTYHVIDHLSKAGVDACRAYWTPILEKNNSYPAMESLFCDSLEYETVLDWTPELPKEFEKRRGYSLLPYLPFIGTRDEMILAVPDVPGFDLEDPLISAMINQDYLETITQCYCENHLAELESMAADYGKTVRYQVAYNKPFEEERSALYVSLPENEALGRYSLDGLKTMAAAAHLGRKKRYSFECSAEFGHSYGQDYEDLFWWIKRALMSGMNAQVLHGASYSGAYHGSHAVNGTLPGVEWPGFEAFGKFVSNYWNRTLSIPDARGCLDAITRMNVLFLKRARVDCAIYRESYCNSGTGSEFHLYPDDGALLNHGYSYETISPALLELSVCQVTEGLLDPDGVGYQCLIIPEQTWVSTAFLQKVQKLLYAGFPILWIGATPTSTRYYSEWQTTNQRILWQTLLEEIWSDSRLIHANSTSEVPAILSAHGILPRVCLDGSSDIMTAVHVDDTNKVRYHMLYAYNRILHGVSDPEKQEFMNFHADTIKPGYQRSGISSRKSITISLQGEGAVYLCNPWDGSIIPLKALCQEGRTHLSLTIEEDELILLALLPKKNSKGNHYTFSKAPLPENRPVVYETLPLSFHTLRLYEFLPDAPKEDQIPETSFLRSHYSAEPHSFSLEALRPWRKLDLSLEYFAGYGVYTASCSITHLEPDTRYILHLAGASDTFRVTVNGKAIAFPDQVLKEADLTNWLQEGDNQIEVCVTSNLYNHLIGPAVAAMESSKEEPESAPSILRRLRYRPRNYGIWDTKEDHCCIHVWRKHINTTSNP